MFLLVGQKIVVDLPSFFLKSIIITGFRDKNLEDKIKSAGAKLVLVPVAKACPPGKEINPKTGRCVKVKTQKVEDKTK